MANLTNVVKVTQAQYSTLINGGTVSGHSYDPDAIYLVDGQGIHIIAQASSSGNGYRLWSNGWVEQWGIVSSGASYSSTTTNVSFTYSFNSGTYNAYATALAGSHYIDGAWITNQGTSSMCVHTGSQATSASNVKCNWYACGWKANS